jgi:hypothetical protein
VLDRRKFRACLGLAHVIRFAYWHGFIARETLAMIGIYEVNACTMSSTCIWPTIIDVATETLAVWELSRLKTALTIARVTGDTINARSVWPTGMTGAIIDILADFGRRKEASAHTLYTEGVGEITGVHEQEFICKRLFHCESFTARVSDHFPICQPTGRNL